MIQNQDISPKDKGNHFRWKKWEEIA